MKIKLRVVPQKPVRKINTINQALDDGNKLSIVMETINKYNANPDDCHFYINNHNPNTQMGFSINFLESEIYFQERMLEYNHLKEDYNKWYLENKEQIEAEKASIASGTRVAEEYNRELKRKDILRQINILETKLQELDNK